MRLSKFVCRPPSPRHPRSSNVIYTFFCINRDHYGVFGCNLFRPDNSDGILDTQKETSTVFIDKEIVFGDAELMEHWRHEHSTPNCGDTGWKCFAAVSEFDFLFVCVDLKSEFFGATRRVVSNCWEDIPFTNPPFGNFFEKVELYIQNIEADGVGRDEDLDFLTINDLAYRSTKRRRRE